MRWRFTADNTLRYYVCGGGASRHAGADKGNVGALKKPLLRLAWFAPGNWKEGGRRKKRTLVRRFSADFRDREKASLVAQKAAFKSIRRENNNERENRVWNQRRKRIVTADREQTADSPDRES